MADAQQEEMDPEKHERVSHALEQINGLKYSASIALIWLCCCAPWLTLRWAACDRVLCGAKAGQEGPKF